MKLKLKHITLIFILATGASVSTYAAENAATKADEAAINSACRGDAKVAGCPDSTVAKGLLVCLNHYKKANKSYKFSSACVKERRRFQHDRKAAKKKA